MLMVIKYQLENIRKLKVRFDCAYLLEFILNVLKFRNVQGGLHVGRIAHLAAYA